MFINYVNLREFQWVSLKHNGKFHQMNIIVHIASIQ